MQYVPLDPSCDARARRIAVTLSVTFAFALAGCGTTRGGHRWADGATLLPSGERLLAAAKAAALDPYTWAPLAGAA